MKLLSFSILFTLTYLLAGMHMAQSQTCTGTPEPGLIDGPSLVCPNTSFTLTVSAYTVADSMGYVWETAPTSGGPWTITTSMSVPSQTFMQSAGTIVWYRLYSFCEATGESNTSNEFQVSAAPYFYCSYCIPSYTIGNTAGDYINGISINGFTNTTGANAAPPNYHVNLGSIGTLGMSMSYEFSIETGDEDNGTVEAWIDYDQDGEFDVTETIFQFPNLSANSTITSTFTVPITSSTGTTGMRVKLVRDSADIWACGAYTYGETEDYTVTLVYVPTCSGQPDGGFVSPFGSLSVVTGTPFTLTAQDVSVGAGISYQWEISYDGGASWTNIAGATQTTFTDTATYAAWYRMKVTCTLSGLYDYTNPWVGVSVCSGPLPVITGVATDASCGNATGSIDISVTGTSPFSYEWTNSTTDEDLINAIAGEHSVTVFDANGCFSSQSFTVENDSPWPIISGIVAEESCQGYDGAIVLTVNSGVAPYVFAWANGLTSDNLDSLNAGTYCVTVSDVNNCSAAECFAVTQSPPMQLTALISNDSVAANWNVDVSVIGGTMPYAYTWSSGNITEDLTGVNADVYCLTVTDANGCVADSCFEIGLLLCDPMFTATYTAGADTSFTLWMDSTVQAWSGSYTWDFGDGSPSVTDPFPVHTYDVSGVYTVCLEALTPTGAVCTYCHDIGIDSSGNVVLRTDADGFIVKVMPFGNTVVPNVAPTELFEVYPNPVSNNSQLRFYAPSATDYTLWVYNTLAQTIETITVNAQAGVNQIVFPTHTLPSGIYQLTVEFEGKQISRSFVK